MNCTTLCREHIVACGGVWSAAEEPCFNKPLQHFKPLFCRIHKTLGCRCGNLLQELFNACQNFSLVAGL